MAREKSKMKAKCQSRMLLLPYDAHISVMWYKMLRKREKDKLNEPYVPDFVRWFLTNRLFVPQILLTAQTDIQFKQSKNIRICFRGF